MSRARTCFADLPLGVRWPTSSLRHVWKIVYGERTANYSKSLQPPQNPLMFAQQAARSACTWDFSVGSRIACRRHLLLPLAPRLTSPGVSLPHSHPGATAAAVPSLDGLESAIFNPLLYHASLWAVSSVMYVLQALERWGVQIERLMCSHERVQYG